MTDREKLTKLLDETFEKQYDRDLDITAYSTANYLLAHDVVPVVRCKDCINAEYFLGSLSCGMARDVIRQENDYCSYGESKDNDSKS